MPQEDFLWTAQAFRQQLYLPLYLFLSLSLYLFPSLYASISPWMYLCTMVWCSIATPQEDFLWTAQALRQQLSLPLYL